MLKIPLNIQKFASGSFECNASSNGKLQCKVEWSSEVNGSTDAEKAALNRSTIKIKVYARRTDNQTTTGTFSGWACIENTSMQGTGTKYGSISNGYQLIYEYSNTVSHNQNGSKSVTIYGSVTGPSGTSLAGQTSSGSRTITLDTIPRYAVTNSVTSDYGSDIERAFKVNYTKYSSSFTYKLRISIPNVQLLERINYNTSGEEFELSPETIYELFGYYNDNSKQYKIGFAIETWNSAGTSKLSDGNEIIITGKIMDANPLFSNFECEDINSTTLALTGDPSFNVNGYSKIKATISQLNHAEAQKRATMSKYRFIIGASSVDINFGDNEYEDVYGEIENATTGTYQIYAIDSRNNSTLVSKLASREIQYTPIGFNSADCNVKRNDGGVGPYAVLTLLGNIWNNNFGHVVNSIKSISYQYKKTTESTWQTGQTVISPVLSDNTFSFTGQVASNEEDYKFELNSSYDFLITIEDELSTKTIQLIMASAIPNLAFADDGIGIMGDYDENIGGPGQVAKNPLAFFPIGAIYLSASPTSPEDLFGGTWEQLKDRFLLGAGDTYTAGNTGGKKELTLSANIGACSNNAASLGYITETPSSYQQNHNADYVIQGTNVGYSHWNHSTPVTEKDVNSRNTNIMPPYLVVYMWKRVA